MQRNRWLVFLLAVALAGLTGLTACGGGGGNTGGGGGGGGGGTTLTGVTIYPGANGATVSVAAGATAQFTAYQSDALVSVTWTASSGTISGNGTSSGTFVAPTTAGSVTISAVSTSNANSGGSVTVNVTAASASGVVVSPGLTVALAGQPVTFTATQNGAAVTPAWEVNGTQGGDQLHGTIDANGEYTPPLTPPPTGSTTITACLPSSNTCMSSATASVTVVFSNNSFVGPYAFSYTGEDATSGYIAAAGHLTAQGNSGLIGTDGVEDEVDLGGTAPDSTFQGDSFGVGPDGRTTVTLGTGEIFQVALTANTLGLAAQHGILIRFDGNATASGTIDAQSTLDLTSESAFSGDYIFGLSGFDENGANLIIDGKFFSDGVINIPPNEGEEDINDGGTFLTVPPTPDLTLSGGFSLDPNEATNGRYLVSLTNTTTLLGGTFTYAAYVVDRTHLKVVEVDDSLFTSGDFFAQTGGAGPYTAAIVLPETNFAFTTGGVSNNGPYAAGGIFASNGGSGVGSTSGTITGGVYDNNDAGTPKLDLPISGAGGGFSIDTFGRITLPIEPNTTTYNYYGYAGTYNSGNGPVNVIEMIDLTAGGDFVDSGLAFRSSSQSTPGGTYAINMSGVTTGANSGEQDVEGVVATGSNSTLTGTVDVNNFATTTSTNTTLGELLTSTSTLEATTGSFGRGIATVNTNSGASFPLAYYVIDGNTVLLFETDSKRVLLGLLNKQY
jgi:hypothetical protein